MCLPFIDKLDDSLLLSSLILQLPDDGYKKWSKHAAAQKPKLCLVAGNKKVCVRRLHGTRGALNARIVVATVSIRLMCVSH
jgi:hypothetical protein